MLSKTRYFNDAITACNLMIDDLVPIAIVPNGEHLQAKYDWGYMTDSPNSLMEYFTKNLLELFPYIRGNIFYPLRSYANLNYKTGHNVFVDPSHSFLNFLERNHSKLEVSFHGITHGHFRDLDNPDFKNNWIHEFEYLNLDDLDNLLNEIDILYKKTGIKLRGGKYTGYMKNEFSEELIEQLGFDWWASSSSMCNRTSKSNSIGVFGKDRQILDIPSNLTGDVFKYSNKMPSIKSLIRKLTKGNFDPQKHLDHLISNGLPITIQEHFQNQRTDGNRQKPNIYDDIFSLRRIYEYLHPLDIWHCTCSELADYTESYMNTEIKTSGDNVEILYTGPRDYPFISFSSTRSRIKELKTGVIYQGCYKKKKWIFNNLKNGSYSLAEE